ncbi:MAG TPA: molybdopterin-guanine dinucleotide biosynthesis protein MobB, partial [Desulfobacteria bacterium]|nr:molybdopterin-guanine dinucleotide biosynthesis protein MobB [Desulfobacteria bacterium]
TWRHAQAGADVVVISSPQKLAMINRVEQELELDQICAQVQGVDLIITEGYKRANKPKIEVFRQGVCDQLLCGANELIALATDREFDLGVPCYGLDDAKGLVDRIEQLFLHNA